MPRDLDNYHPEYPKIAEVLVVNPYRKAKETGKKKKAKKDDGEGGARRLRDGKGGKDGAGGGFAQLEPNYKQEYKVYEFGNYPQLSDGKPRGGQFRLMLPCDADWTGKDEMLPPEKTDVKDEKNQKKGKKK